MQWLKGPHHKQLQIITDFMGTCTSFDDPVEDEGVTASEETCLVDTKNITDAEVDHCRCTYASCIDANGVAREGCALILVQAVTGIWKGGQSCKRTNCHMERKQQFVLLVTRLID